VWPSTVFNASNPITNSESTLTLRVFTKPLGAPPQIALRKSYVRYESPNINPTQYLVPNFVKSVSFYVFGAGGSSTGTSPGGNGSFAFGTFYNLAGKNVYIYVGNGGGFTPRTEPVVNGGLNGSLTGGGGLSGVKLEGKWLIVAGGGGQSTTSKAQHELSSESRSLFHGKPGVVLSSIGENALNGGGAGGSGFYGGSKGQRGQPGGAGSSLVPVGGFISQNIEKQKFWFANIGCGAITTAGPGFVALEFLY
jgi:hypothetical protein